MTADTYSNTLGFLVMGTGNDNNTWGGNANTAVFQIFEDAIANALSSAVTGGTLDLSGSPPPAAASQARYAALIFSGVLASNQTVKVPNLQKFWFVQNGTSGAFTLKIQTPSGSASTAIPQNSGWQVVYCDGSNNIVVHPFNTKQIQMPDGSVSAPPHGYLNETNSGWYRAGTQDHRLAINGVDVLQVTGPGASSPSICNVLSPLVLQLAGVQLIPPGMEIDYSGLTEPTGWYFPAGQTKSRATDANLFNAIAPTAINGTAITGNTHTSTTIDSLSVDLRGLGLIGAFIEGTGITNGTTITAITATSLTLSQATSGSASGVALRVSPYGLGDGSTTFKLPDRRGTVTAIRDDLNGSAAGKLTASTSQGIDGTKLGASGGEQAHTQTQAELVAHAHNFAGNPLAPHAHTISNAGSNAGGFGVAVSTMSNVANTTPSTDGASAGTPSGTISSTGSGSAFNVVQPTSICNRLIKR